MKYFEKKRKVHMKEIELLLPDFSGVIIKSVLHENDVIARVRKTFWKISPKFRKKITKKILGNARKF